MAIRYDNNINVQKIFCEILTHTFVPAFSGTHGTSAEWQGTNVALYPLAIRYRIYVIRSRDSVDVRTYFGFCLIDLATRNPR